MSKNNHAEPKFASLSIKGHGTTNQNGNYTVVLNGIDISHQVSDVELSIHANEINKASITFVVDELNVEDAIAVQEKAL